jgi:hypothetical protein
MPRVSKVRWTSMNLDYGYMFHIKTQAELRHYWTVSRSGSIQRGVGEALEAVRGNRHVTSGDGALAQMKLQNGESLLTVADVFSEVLTGMRQSLREKGEIFVNQHGGYFAWFDGLEISGTKKVSAYVLPANIAPKITISRWPEGTHWYARVDGEDVELDGYRKWLSRIEAEAAAKEWCKERGLDVG